MTADATMTVIEKENSMTQFGTVEPSAQGDTYKPADNVGHLIVIKPTGIRTGIPRKQPKPGEDPTMDGIRCDILDLDRGVAPRSDDESGKPGNIYKDALLMGGQWTDALRDKMGQLVVVTSRKKRSSTSGFDFVYPDPAGNAEIKRAGEYWSANGDPFVKFDTTDPLS